MGWNVIIANEEQTEAIMKKTKNNLSFGIGEFVVSEHDIYYTISGIGYECAFHHRIFKNGGPAFLRGEYMKPSTGVRYDFDLPDGEYKNLLDSVIMKKYKKWLKGSEI